MGAIAFRPFGVDDLQQVFLWLIKPHVVRGYAAAPGSFTEFVAKYGPRTRAGNVVQAFIVTLDGADVGYIQTYAVSDFPDYASQIGCEPGVAAIDLFIGEEAVLDSGIGSDAARRFVEEVVFARNGASACVAGPPEGSPAVGAFEKAGFRHWKTVKVEGSQPECVMRCENRGQSPFSAAFEKGL